MILPICKIVVNINTLHCIWYLIICIKFTDSQVAFVVGGGISPQAELYSPEGKCQYALPPLSKAKFTIRPPLALIDNKIYTCGQLGNSG